MNVNEEPQELTAYLASLTPEQQLDVIKWSDLPAGDLVIPTERRAQGLLNRFRAQHEIVPTGQRNLTLFKYSCCLRRCGFDEKAILERLWNFTEGHCKPPHKRDNSADAAELSSLADRAFRFVKVGFPRSKKAEPSEKQERSFVVEGDRIYLSCVDSKNNYFFVHIGTTCFAQSCIS